MGRRTGAALVVTTMLATTVLTAPSAHAGPESDLASMANAERRSRGIRTVSVRGDLTDVARRHARRMASSGRLYHNPNLRGEVSGWERIGENVGRGASARQIHRLFMSSSSHRAVILQPAFNQIGVGVAWRGDTMYVSQVFVERGGSRDEEPRVRTRATRSTTRAVARSTSSPTQARRAIRRQVVRPARAVGTMRALRRMSDFDEDVSRAYAAMRRLPGVT